jgi:hypothetical protein
VGRPRKAAQEEQNTASNAEENKAELTSNTPVTPKQETPITGSNLTKVAINSINLTDVVKRVLYAGWLGGSLDVAGIRLHNLPYVVNCFIPEDKLEEWTTQSEMQVEEEGQKYNGVTLSTPNHLDFFRQLIILGKLGCFVPKGKITKHVKPKFICQLQSKNPITENVYQSRDGSRPVYTRGELNTFSREQLHVIRSWYRLPKTNGFEDILKYYRDNNLGGN